MMSREFFSNISTVLKLFQKSVKVKSFFLELFLSISLCIAWKEKKKKNLKTKKKKKKPKRR